MRTYSFPQGVHQHFQFTSCNLDSEEQELVEAFVSLDGAENHQGALWDIAGRSFFLESPTRHKEHRDLLRGQFTSLQVIGAGGWIPLHSPRQYTVPKHIPIRAVDPTNHAEELRGITQLRTVNEHGVIDFSHRTYVPLGGMDIGEAASRAAHTLGLEETIDEMHERGVSPHFIVPRLAATGMFPDMHDDQGRPLQWQVYRVPTLPRLAVQLSPRRHMLSFKEMVGGLTLPLFDFGKMLHNMHCTGRAYIDGHLGNVSSVYADNAHVLYATDLGSMKATSPNDTTDRYRGLDLYAVLLDVRDMISDEVVYDTDTVPLKVQYGALNGLVYALLSGYYSGYVRQQSDRRLIKKASDYLLPVSLAGDLDEFCDAVSEWPFTPTMVCFDLSKGNLSKKEKAAMASA